MSVFDGELVIDGVPVNDEVKEDVSDPLIVGVGEDEEDTSTLLDIDIDAPEDKVVVGDDVEELLRLIEVEGVGKGVIVELPVPLIVAVGEGVCVEEVDGDDSILDVIDGDVYIERLGVAVGVDEPDKVEELLDVPDGEFVGD